MKSLIFKIIIIVPILVAASYVLYRYAIVPFTTSHEYVYDFGKQSGLRFDARPASLKSFLDYTDDSVQLGYIPVVRTNDFRISVPLQKTIIQKQTNVVNLEMTFKVPKELADLRVRTENYPEWKNIYYKLLDNLGTSTYSKGATHIWAQKELTPEEQQSILDNKVLPDSVTRPVYTHNTILISNVLPQAEKKSEYSYDISSRGAQKAYIYIPDDRLNISVKKYDLNWYDGRDDVIVNILSLKGEKLYSFTIPDDGITNADERGGKIIQEKRESYALGAGIYEVEINAGDAITTTVSGNFPYFVLTDHYFLAASPLYREGITDTDLPPSSNVRLFADYTNFNIFTTHTVGLQKLVFGTQEVQLNTINKPAELTAKKPEVTRILAEKPDLVMTFDGYISPTREGFFRPFPSNVRILDRFSQITNDTIVVGNYESVVRNGDFITIKTSFLLETLPSNLTFEFTSSNLGVIGEGLEIKRFVVSVK